ncbi:MAG: hypothetical protein WCJ02_02740 [bacterium]
MADSYGGRDRARPSRNIIPSFQYSNIPVKLLQKPKTEYALGFAGAQKNGILFNLTWKTLLMKDEGALCGIIQKR